MSTAWPREKNKQRRAHHVTSEDPRKRGESGHKPTVTVPSSAERRHYRGLELCALGRPTPHRPQRGWPSTASTGAGCRRCPVRGVRHLRQARAGNAVDHLSRLASASPSLTDDLNEPACSDDIAALTDYLGANSPMAPPGTSAAQRAQGGWLRSGRLELAPPFFSAAPSLQARPQLVQRLFTSRRDSKGVLANALQRGRQVRISRWVMWAPTWMRPVSTSHCWTAAVTSPAAASTRRAKSAASNPPVGAEP